MLLMRIVRLFGGFLHHFQSLELRQKREKHRNNSTPSPTRKYPSADAIINRFTRWSNSTWQPDNQPSYPWTSKLSNIFVVTCKFSKSAKTPSPYMLKWSCLHYYHHQDSSRYKKGLAGNMLMQLHFDNSKKRAGRYWFIINNRMWNSWTEKHTNIISLNIRKYVLSSLQEGRSGE